MKCSKCGKSNGVHKMGCETQKITIMADMTKCVGTDCPHKETCYRYTSPVNDFWQLWLNECPLKDGECDMYREVTKYSIKQ